MFQDYVLSSPYLMAEELPKLAEQVLEHRKVLICWCAPPEGLTKDDPLQCHGQILLRLIANL